jgi:hypothetical protein
VIAPVKDPPLTHERLLEVLTYDAESGEFVWLKPGHKKAGKSAGCLSARGYRYIEVDGRAYVAARLAYFYMVGTWPPHEVDHKNHCADDNRWINLRPATRAQNTENRRRWRDKKSSLPLGVCHSYGGKFKAGINKNGKYHHLGTFSTPEAASIAYQAAARELFGEFAVTAPTAKPTP